MPEARPDPGNSAFRAFMGRADVPVCRRLQLVSVLLLIVGGLGLASAAAMALDMGGEGLDGLLGRSEADLWGQVRTSEGRLVQGATVTYMGTGASSTTNITGWYFLDNVRTGKVEVRMEAAGYKTVVKTAYLERGQYVLDFLAEPGSGTVEVEGDPVARPGDAIAGRSLLVGGIVVVSVLALLGSLAAYWHRWYPLALAGALLGILSWGWFIGSVLSVMAFVVLLPLKRHFGENANECPVPWHEPPPPSLPSPDEDALEVSPAAGVAGGTAIRGGMPPGG